MSKARDNQCGLAKAGAPPFCGSEEGVGASTVGVPLQLGKSNNASLLSKNNSLERAVDWIFSHIDDLDAEAAMDISEGRSAADSISESVPVGPKVRDGPGSECPWETEQSTTLDPHFEAALLPSRECMGFFPLMSLLKWGF